MAVILVVDDASLIRTVVKRAIEDAGHTAVLAKDGKEGLEVTQTQKIDFVLSDVNMPIMGGLEMVAKIRDNEKTKYLPIVMLTTEDSDFIKAKGKALGVQAWLVKPFNKDKVLFVLKKLLG